MGPMMSWRDVSIKHKLTLILMLASSLTVLVACLAFYGLVVNHFQKVYKRDMNNLALIVGSNCKAALMFDVPEDADTVLATLKGRKTVRQVILYDNLGQVFASYKAPVLKGASAREFCYFAQKIILDDGTYVGRIVIEDDMRDMARGRKQILFILLLVAVGSLFSAFWLSALLRNVVSKPLMALTEMVKRIAAGDFQFEERSCMRGRDEMGVLCTAFVEMNKRLRDSHERLEEYNRTLEGRVAARTEELQNAMDDLRKSQAQLVQSEKMAALGQLVAGVAHDINNNINFIAGALPNIKRMTNNLIVEMAENHKASPAWKMHLDIISLLANAEEGVRRTKKIVQDLNAFSRSSHGQFVPVDVHAELNNIINLLRYECRDRVEIIRDFDPDLPAVYCQRDHMSQAYMNILLNAIQAIGKRGTIWLKTWLSGDKVYISFRDNGSGMEPEVLKHIFDPFFSTKPVGQGTGLGLSISYNVVKNHHGKIKVDSSPGRGTEIVITLLVEPHKNVDDEDSVGAGE